MSLAALLLCAWAAAAAPASAPREVTRSTAPASGAPASIPDLKKRIQATQAEILKLRAKVKRAAKLKDAAGEAKAREAWLKEREKLKADREALKAAIVTQEAAELERGVKKPASQLEKAKP